MSQAMPHRHGAERWASPVGEGPLDRAETFDDAWMILGYACDARCRFCYVEGQKPRAKPQQMIGRELRRARSSCRGGRIGFSGGEPTLRRDVVGLVRLARECGFDFVHLFSNGRRFADAAFTRQMAEAGLGGAMISMHGCREATNDWNMGSPGSEATWQGLANLTACGVRVIVNCVVNRSNLDELLPLYRRCRAISPPLDELRITYPSFQRAALDNIALALPYEAVLPVLEELLHGAEGLRVRTEVFPLCLVPGGEGNAVEWVYRRQVDYMSPEDRCGNDHRRVWSAECLGCANRFACTGIQEAYVRHFGPPPVRPRAGTSEVGPH